MKHLLFCFCLMLSALTARAQYNAHGFKIPPPIPVSRFASVYEAADIIKKISNTAQWQANFKVREAPGENNAYATIMNGSRYIVYDNEFCESVDYWAHTKWASISILAHEVGHHYYNHVLDARGSTPPKELEADKFSGYVLAKMGASLDEAKAAMAAIASDYESSSHPAKGRRLTAIEEGWRMATGSTATAPTTAGKKRNEGEWIHLFNGSNTDLYVELSDNGSKYETVRIPAGQKFVFKYEIYSYGWARISTRGRRVGFKLHHANNYIIKWDSGNQHWSIFNY